MKKPTEWVWRTPTTAADYRPRLAGILHKWQGTPYLRGQQCPCVGVDCVGLVCGVLDELHGRYDPTEFVRWAEGMAFHDREATMRALYRIRGRFAPNSLVKDGSMEPGDVLWVGPPGHLGIHAMLVGTDPYSYWHATEAVGVVKVGQGYFSDRSVYYVIRSGDREGWARG